mgnify:FL=1
MFNMDMEEVHSIITKEGVICDLRKPSVMRIAPAPMSVCLSTLHAGACDESSHPDRPCSSRLGTIHLRTSVTS